MRRRCFRQFFKRNLRGVNGGRFRFWLVQWGRSRARGGIKVSWLQRRGSRFTLARLRFFALETIAHPFAHVWLLTQRHTGGQWMRLQENQDRQAKTAIENSE
jgi:hypothetical protein